MLIKALSDMDTINIAKKDKKIEQLDFRKLFSKFATGVAILLIKCKEKNAIQGLTINSFSSLSLDPLLVAFSIKTSSKFFTWLNELSNTYSISINILSSDQKGLSNICSKYGGGELDQDYLLENKNFAEIKNSLAVIHYSISEKFVGGDHTIFVC